MRTDQRMQFCVKSKVRKTRGMGRNTGAEGRAARREFKSGRENAQKSLNGGCARTRDGTHVLGEIANFLRSFHHLSRPEPLFFRPPKVVLALLAQRGK